VPQISRYVIDLNRPATTADVPRPEQHRAVPDACLHRRAAVPARPGAPDAQEIGARVARYWQPYHDALQAELQRIRAAHGHAVLFDAHSIKGELPWLFEGTLPDLNLGTVSGASCAPSLRDALAAVLAAQSRFSFVVDGRFKGGYITRQYGRPTQGVHAVQLEMSWRTYMDEAPPLPLGRRTRGRGDAAAARAGAGDDRLAAGMSAPRRRVWIAQRAARRAVS
jgi:N-formylglutamate deformylase